MSHFIHTADRARLVVLALACSSLFSIATVRAENDDIGAALGQARIQYEEKLQKIREGVLQKLDTKQAALRGKTQPKLEEISELESARSAFKTSGRWPSFRNFNDCQTKLRKAVKNLEEAYARAETDYLKAGHDDAAKAVRAEHEQFLKECDINSWNDNVIAHWNDEQCSIGSVCKTIHVGAFANGPYRLELIAQAMDGDGSLTLDIPVSGRKRIEVMTLPATGDSIHILLSIRESLISADHAVARPIAAGMRKKDDETLGTLVLGCNHGRIRLRSVRFKPIHSAAAGDVAFAAEGNSAPPPIVAKDDGETFLPRTSRWRGYGWHGQNPNDLKRTLIADAAVTFDESERVELQTDGWGNCSQTWVFQLSGNRLQLAEIHSKCAKEFTEILGEGFLDGENLQFQCSSRVGGHSINTIVYSKFELRRIMKD